MFHTFVFYAFALILLLAAIRVITTRNPVHAALFLVLTFGTAAVLWLLLEAEFLAIALVLVYVGRGDGAVPVRRHDARHQHRSCCARAIGTIWCRGSSVAGIMVAEMTIVLIGKHAGLLEHRRTAGEAGRLQQHQRARPRDLHRLCVSRSRSRRSFCWWPSSRPSH